MILYKRNKDSTIDIWPAYADAMAAFLLVVIFIVVILIFAQSYLQRVLNTNISHLNETSQNLEHLTKQYEIKTAENLEINKKFSINSNELNQKNEQLKKTLMDLENLYKQHDVLNRKNEDLILIQEILNRDILVLQDKVKDKDFIKNELDKTQEFVKQKNLEIDDVKKQVFQLQQELDQSKQSQVDKIFQIDNLYEYIKEMNDFIDKLKAKLDYHDNLNQIGRYRSEFFERLVSLLGNRKDMRVVGDRFVFQSEILFDVGSAKIGEQGMLTLNKLAQILKNIAIQIPKGVQWILRVDGHTDPQPIHNQLYRDNWELSLARAVAVVRYLIDQGIDPKHLAATGFGSSYPLDEIDFAKDRRIEFKLDQR